MLLIMLTLTHCELILLSLVSEHMYSLTCPHSHFPILSPRETFKIWKLGVFGSSFETEKCHSSPSPSSGRRPRARPRPFYLSRTTTTMDSAASTRRHPTPNSLLNLWHTTTGGTGQRSTKQITKFQLVLPVSTFIFIQFILIRWHLF
jgi:hypothetical protein